MNPIWIRRVLWLAMSGLATNVAVMIALNAFLSASNLRAFEMPWAMRLVWILGSLAFFGGTLALWLNEIVLRGREENHDFGDRAWFVLKMIALNVFGAYFFAIRRVRDSGN